MRPLVVKDAAAVEELEIELFPDNCLNQRSLTREISVGVGLAEEREGKLVAYMLGRWDFDEQLLDILRLGVLKHARRQGIASAMLRDLTDHVACDVMLTVAKGNVPAIKLYRGFGFQIIGETRRNNWVMRRSTC